MIARLPIGHLMGATRGTTSDKNDCGQISGDALDKGVGSQTAADISKRPTEASNIAKNEQ